MSKLSTQQAINLIRENGSELMQSSIPEITEDMDISVLSTPLFQNPDLANEFVSALVNKIIEQQVNLKIFSNRLKFLEGKRIPLGQVVEDIYINPAKGRNFDGDDFAGILEKYESDVKAQYLALNMDRQYPVTISRQRLRTAMMSWETLEDFIVAQTNSLYSGAYIDEYMYTKGIVASAYVRNRAIIEQIDAISTEQKARDFITKCRTYFKNFQDPSTNYNSWSKCGGVGRPIKTWTEAEDIVFIIRNDILSFIDVNVLAVSMNIDKATLMGNIVGVNDFNMYDDKENLIFDGSKVIGIMADKAWFKIRTQDIFMDNAKNANNRTWNYYLNYIKMYQFSLFANGIIFAEELPTGVDTTEINVVTTDLSITKGVEKTVELKITPPNTTDFLQAITTAENVTVTTTNDNKIKVLVAQAFDGESVTITATSGNVSKNITLTLTT